MIVVVLDIMLKPGLVKISEFVQILKRVAQIVRRYPKPFFSFLRKKYGLNIVWGYVVIHGLNIVIHVCVRYRSFVLIFLSCTKDE
jgi:hypothetical protein